MRSGDPDDRGVTFIQRPSIAAAVEVLQIAYCSTLMLEGEARRLIVAGVFQWALLLAVVACDYFEDAAGRLMLPRTFMTFSLALSVLHFTACGWELWNQLKRTSQDLLIALDRVRVANDLFSKLAPGEISSDTQSTRG